MIPLKQKSYLSRSLYFYINTEEISLLGWLLLYPFFLNKVYGYYNEVSKQRINMFYMRASSEDIVLLKKQIWKYGCRCVIYIFLRGITIMQRSYLLLLL